MGNVSLEYISPTVAATAVAGLVKNLPRILTQARDLGTDSLIEYTKMTRVEPMVLFDETLRLQPFTPDIMSALVNIFSGYYLQAVAISANVGNIEVRRLLSKIDPDRSRNAADTAADLLSRRYVEGVDLLVSQEAETDAERRRRQRRDDRRRDRDARMKEEQHEARKMDRLRDRRREHRDDLRRERDSEIKEEQHYARMTDRERDRIRAERDDLRRDRDSEIKEEQHEARMSDRERDIPRQDIEDERRREKHELEMSDAAKRAEQSIGVSRTSIDDFNTNANLSMGKMITVEIESDGKKANIPVNIRLIVKNVPPQSLASFLTVIKSDRRARSRWKRYRGGELSFFKDLILCQDIIDEERKAHYSDKSGIFRNIRHKLRSKENSAIDIATGDINVANASSIVVMSKDTASEVERALMGKIDNFNTREELLKITFTMILVIVDVKWEKVLMYHKSISEPSILSIRDFKSKSKDSGPDINEILMAYRAGTAPTF